MKFSFFLFNFLLQTYTEVLLVVYEFDAFDVEYHYPPPLFGKFFHEKTNPMFFPSGH